MSPDALPDVLPALAPGEETSPEAALAAALATTAAGCDSAEARDARFMAAALELARASTGATYPNPCVGAVVVQGDRIVGAGWSSPTGGPHAEVRALQMAGEAARGATIYITLEPCSHFGRTPPCTGALIAAGVAEAVFGVRDPARHAAGQSVPLLQSAGVRVREGVLGTACASVHAHYLRHERTRRPFVTLKVASSLDGRIAAVSGDSKWISGEPARRLGHWLRARHHAIAVGADTLLRDDPQLNVRMVAGADPVPVVFDSALRTAGAANRPQLLRPGTFVLHTDRADEAARRALDELGVRRVEVAADARGRVDIAAALEALGQLPLRSLLVEGGGHLLASFLAANAWQRWYWFHAPVVLGEGRPALPGLGWTTVAEAPRLAAQLRVSLGDDGLTVLRPLGDPAE